MRPILFFFLFIASPFAAVADSFRTTAVVTDVTVYADGTIMTLKAPVDLPPGVHDLILVGVPELSGMPQIAFGTGQIDVIAVRGKDWDLVTVQLPMSNQARRAFEELEKAQQAVSAIESQASQLEAEIEAAGVQLEWFKTLPTRSGWPEQDTAAVAAEIASGMVTAREKEREAKAAFARLQHDLEFGRAEVEQAQAALAAVWQSGFLSPTLVVTVDVAQAFQGEAQLKVAGEGVWAPYYIANVGQSGSAVDVEVERMAMIENSGDIPWLDVNLTISTAQINRWANGTVPQERARTLRPIPEPDPVEAQAGAMGVPVMEPEVIVENSGGNLEQATNTWEQTFPVPVSVVSESTILIDIGRLSFSSTAWARVTNGNPVLMAELTNETQAEIHAGGMEINRNGIPMGRTEFPYVRPGEDFELQLGALIGLNVDRTTLRRESGEAGIVSSLESEIELKRLTVTSNLDYAIETEFLHAFRVSEDEDLVFSQLAKPRPTETDFEGRRGVARWWFMMQPGQTMTIDYGEESRWPVGQEVVRSR